MLPFLKRYLGTVQISGLNYVQASITFRFTSDVFSYLGDVITGRQKTPALMAMPLVTCKRKTKDKMSRETVLQVRFQI